MKLLPRLDAVLQRAAAFPIQSNPHRHLDEGGIPGHYTADAFKSALADNQVCFPGPEKPGQVLRTRCMPLCTQ